MYECVRVHTNTMIHESEIAVCKSLKQTISASNLQPYIASMTLKEVTPYEITCFEVMSLSSLIMLRPTPCSIPA